MRSPGPAWLLTFAFAAALAHAAAIAGEARGKADAALVKVERIEVRASLVGPVVLLQVQNRAIPIFVDAVVATGIQAALAGEKMPRPLTHELMRSVLEGFDGKVTRVVITLKGPTYYADLTVAVHGTTKVFDSRSSDGIALAVHFSAPVYVTRETFDKAGTVLDEPQPSKPGEVRL